MRLQRLKELGVVEVLLSEEDCGLLSYRDLGTGKRVIPDEWRGVRIRRKEKVE